MPGEVHDVGMLDGKPTIKQWVTTSMKNGIRLNSQKLIDFAEQIDKKFTDGDDNLRNAQVRINNRLSGVDSKFEEVNTQLSAVYSKLPVSGLTKMFGIDKLPYSCEQSITLPGGLLHFNFLTKDIPALGDVSPKANDFDMILNKKSRKSKTTYNTTKQTVGSDTMPVFAGYQKCSDGGYNIFYIFGADSYETIKMATLKNKPRYKDYGEPVADPSKIEGIKLPDDSAPSVFNIIGTPLDEVTLKPLSEKSSWVATYYAGSNIKTTLYSTLISEPNAGSYYYDSQKLVETFMDVSIYGNAMYEDNQYKLRRYYMKINHMYLRVTEANDDIGKTTTVYHIRNDY